MNDNDIRIIPIPGPPLQYDSSETTRSVFPVPEAGFFIGRENFILTSLVQNILDDKLLPEQFPVLFFGPVGCGKTHLLRGICEVWSKRQSAMESRKRQKIRSVYLSATEFARHLSDALETRTTGDFRHRFRNLELFALDGLDGIATKTWAVEEFLHTLDQLRNDNAIILCSSGKNPFEPRIFPKALVSRLVAGTTIPLLPPGFATRKRFLTSLAAAFHAKLSDSALAKAAEKLPYTISKLYGCFLQAVFLAESQGNELSNRFFLSFLDEQAEDERPEIKLLLKRSAGHFGLNIGDLRGKSRNKTVSLARSIAAYLARQKGGLPFKEIARQLGNRDVSTVRHLVERIQTELKDDAALRDHIARIADF